MLKYEEPSWVRATVARVEQLALIAVLIAIFNPTQITIALSTTACVLITVVMDGARVCARRHGRPGAALGLMYGSMLVGVVLWLVLLWTYACALAS